MDQDRKSQNRLENDSKIDRENRATGDRKADRQPEQKNPYDGEDNAKAE